jgi:hypothetical protein
MNQYNYRKCRKLEDGIAFATMGEKQGNNGVVQYKIALLRSVHQSITKSVHYYTGAKTISMALPPK